MKHIDYKKVCFKLYSAMADAIDCIDAGDPQRAKALLVAAHQRTEKMVMEKPDGVASHIPFIPITRGSTSRNTVNRANVRVNDRIADAFPLQIGGLFNYNGWTIFWLTKTYRYDIPNGYGIEDYQDIPAHTVKVICPFWWRNPNRRDAIYSLMVDEKRDNISLPDGAIWAPMMEMNDDLHHVESLIHWQIEHKLVKHKTGMSIREGKLKHSSLCATIQLHLMLDVEDELGSLSAIAMCYLGSDGYQVNLYLYENAFECGKYGVLKLSTGPLSYNGLKEHLVEEIKTMPKKKLVAFVKRAPKTIQFPGVGERPTNWAPPMASTRTEPNTANSAHFTPSRV